jgi:hypothetical protein
MPQISLYIDESTLKKVESAAKQKNISISKWVGEQIRSQLDPKYPSEFDKLFGSIDDESFIEPNELNFSSDLNREVL